MGTKNIKIKSSKIRLIFYISIFLILVFSIIEFNLTLLSFSNDKLIHLLVFLYLSITALLSDFKINIWFLYFILIFYGFIIEVLQSFLPYRFFELNDLLMNIIGVTIAFFFYYKKDKKNY